MSLPTDLKYAKSHEWVRIEDDSATVGITDHAQEELNDVVYVELPEIGREVAVGDPVAVVESVKAASDIYSPLAGKVVAVNEALNDDPSLVNSEPYGEGWILKLSVEGEAGGSELLDAEGYQGLIG